MMDCATFRELAFDYLARDLPRGHADVFEAHFVSCASCAATLRAVEAHEELLSRAGVPAAPDDIWPRIEAVVSTSRPAVRPQRAGMGWLAAAAALLLIVCGVLASIPQSTVGPELEVVEVRGEASETLSGFIPGYEEPGAGARVAGTFLAPGGSGK